MYDTYISIFRTNSVVKTEYFKSILSISPTKSSFDKSISTNNNARSKQISGHKNVYLQI